MLYLHAHLVPPQEPRNIWKVVLRQVGAPLALIPSDSKFLKSFSVCFLTLSFQEVHEPNRGYDSLRHRISGHPQSPDHFGAQETASSTPAPLQPAQHVYKLIKCTPNPYPVKPLRRITVLLLLALLVIHPLAQAAAQDDMGTGGDAGDALQAAAEITLIQGYVTAYGVEP
jgi:hypothetical protein